MLLSQFLAQIVLIGCSFLVPSTMPFVVPTNRATSQWKQKDGIHLSTHALSSSGSMEKERDTVVGPQNVTKQGAAEKGMIQKLSSEKDFLTFVDEARPNSLAVIKFYSKNCPLCRRVELKYKKMARFYQNAPIQFAEIQRSPTRDHAEDSVFSILGVHTYPFLHIYRNAQCVAAHGTESEKTFEPIVHNTIQRELLMTDDDWDDFLAAFAAPIQQSTDKLERLRSLL